MVPLFRLLLLLAFSVGARAADPVLKVTAPDQTLALTAVEFAALPRTEFRAIAPHENRERFYSGVAVRELLARVGAPLGDKLRGPALTLGVLVRCQDGYTVLFSLAEFDESFSSRTLLLADREDGQPVPAGAAPFRLVVPGDKHAARWARKVTSIEIVSFAPRP